MTTNSNETSKADPTHLGHIISSDYYIPGGGGGLIYETDGDARRLA